MITIGYVDKNGKVLLKTVPDYDDLKEEYEFKFIFDDIFELLFFCGTSIIIILILFICTWINFRKFQDQTGNTNIIDTV